MAWVQRAFERAVHALAEALYPANALGAPDGSSTQLGPRTVSHVLRLPRGVRVQVMALFLAANWLAPVLSPVGGPLSWRAPAARLSAVQGWRHSQVYLLRLMGNGLHAQLQMLYLSHPAVSAHIGEHKPVAYPHDAYAVTIRARESGA